MSKLHRITDWEWDFIKTWRAAKARFNGPGESSVIQLTIKESDRHPSPMTLNESIQQFEGPLTSKQLRKQRGLPGFPTAKDIQKRFCRTFGCSLPAGHLGKCDD